MKLEVLNVVLEAIELLRPIVVRIKKHDRNLARQITDAAHSNILNTGEGALSDPGTRRSRYQSAAGSANEVRVGPGCHSLGLRHRGGLGPSAQSLRSRRGHALQAHSLSAPLRAGVGCVDTRSGHACGHGTQPPSRPSEPGARSSAAVTGTATKAA
jgi:hypothetical protein